MERYEQEYEKEEQRKLAEVRKLLTHLVEKGKVTFTDDDLREWDIDAELISGFVERIEPDNYYCENCTYILVPANVKLSSTDYEFFAFMTLHGWIFLQEKEFDELIARWLYERYADGFEFVDEDNYGYAAWWLYRVFASYDIEADEKIDRYDYRHAYKGPVYYRFGSKWLVRDVDYCNTNRWETASGIFKGATYSIVDSVPPEE